MLHTNRKVGDKLPIGDEYEFSYLGFSMSVEGRRMAKFELRDLSSQRVVTVNRTVGGELAVILPEIGLQVHRGSQRQVRMTIEADSHTIGVHKKEINKPV